MTQTIERNYRKHPHTANFLMTFHAAAAGLPADLDENAAEYALAMADDLLELVPDEAPVFVPGDGQRKLISDLVSEISVFDRGTAETAAAYTRQMTVNQRWTPENTRIWIGRLIAKKRELELAGREATAVTVPDGRYAVEEDGALRFFRVKNGRKPGFVFLDVQASDDWHAIRVIARIRSIIASIARDAEEASLRYGRELGICGDCGRTLTDETSRARGRGPICDARH